jgi:hypothetical protein
MMNDQYRNKAIELLSHLNVDYSDADLKVIADALREAEERGFEKAKSACIAAVERMPAPKVTLSRECTT